jgi:hypothetical protein
MELLTATGKLKKFFYNYRCLMFAPRVTRHTSNISSCKKNFFSFPVPVNNSIKVGLLVCNHGVHYKTPCRLNEQRVNVNYLSQTVSHRSLSAEDQVNSPSCSYEFCGSQSGNDTVCPPSTSAFRCQYHSIGVSCSFIHKQRNRQCD